MVGNGISFSGLASGLDTRAIIDQLMAIERLPIRALEEQKAASERKVGLIGTFKGLVTTLQGAADGLRTAQGFYDFVATTSREGVATVAAASGAQAGTHTLLVESTATIDRWAFDGVADDTLDLASADGESVSFTVDGTSYSVAVNQAESSLAEIALAINSAAGGDVSASVVDVGPPGAPSHRLVLSSDHGGETGRITGISSSIAGLTIDGTEPDAGGSAQSANNITVGNNAVAYVDGLRVERADNDFSGVLEGIAIDLVSDGGGEAITFTVGADRDAIRTGIQEFVDAYNGVIDFINQQSEFTEEGGRGGELFGDSLLRDVQSRIRHALFDVDLATVLADTEGFSTLSLVGIEQDSDGRLSIDAAAFDAKFDQNLGALADLFADFDGFERASDDPNDPGYFQDATADSGLADNLYRAIDRMFGTLQGPIIDPDTGERRAIPALFDSRTGTLNEHIERLDEQIEAKERLLESVEQSLVLRFAALEELMGQLNAQGAALTSSLAQLPTFTP